MMYAKSKLIFVLCFLTTFVYLLVTFKILTWNFSGTVHTETKYVLYWTKQFDREDFELGLGHGPFKNCKISKCYVTSNKSFLPIDYFDALVFHAKEYNTQEHGIPSKRKPNQVYIFGLLESPYHMGNFDSKTINKFYNWTMTYRRDSDVWRPYGRVWKKKTNYVMPAVDSVLNKTSLVAWFVSHCDTISKREDVTKMLQKYVQVDIYGGCGPLKSCPRSQESQCYAMLDNKYKFYLSFENSKCEDYVTEKLYKILNINVVPIVYVGCKYEELAPPNSVINVENYKSIQELVNYIIYLDQNPMEYLKYFEWKKYYVITDNTSESTMCSLCEKLHDPHQQTTIYENMHEWWTIKDQACKIEFPWTV